MDEIYSNFLQGIFKFPYTSTLTRLSQFSISLNSHRLDYYQDTTLECIPKSMKLTCNLDALAESPSQFTITKI